MISATSTATPLLALPGVKVQSFVTRISTTLPAVMGADNTSTSVVASADNLTTPTCTPLDSTSTVQSLTRSWVSTISEATTHLAATVCPVPVPPATNGSLVPAEMLLMPTR